MLPLQESAGEQYSLKTTETGIYNFCFNFLCLQQRSFTCLYPEINDIQDFAEKYA